MALGVRDDDDAAAVPGVSKTGRGEAAWASSTINGMTKAKAKKARMSFEPSKRRVVRLNVEDSDDNQK